MTTENIKFNVIKELNGIKYLSQNQVEQFKSHVIDILNLNDTDENNQAIEDGIRIYFKLLN